MKKNLIIILLLITPGILIAQGHTGKVDDCAPIVAGKVCYTDEVEMPGVSKNEIFDAINNWAKKTYGKDVFLSNVSANKERGSILISSKIELLLNDIDSTQVKFKMNITCHDNKYVIDTKDIKFLYDPATPKKYKTYSAEDVIANNGKSNKIAAISDPELFCNATFFFFQNLFADVYNAASEAEK